MVPVGVVSGGKSCSNSIFIGESAKVTCFSSVASSLENFDGGGVVLIDSGKVVIVVVVWLPVEEGGGEGSLTIALDIV